MAESKGETDSSSGGKRKRSPNFTEKEIKILMKLVFAHIDIIESKKTDSETWKIKDIVWNTIAENFNNCSGTLKRTVETLRQKYDSVKKLARKKDAKNREEENKSEPDYIDMEDYEAELLRILEMTGNGTGSYESTNPLASDNNIKTNIKIESLVSNHHSSSNPLVDDFRDEERFTITDDDLIWDLPTDETHRPRLNFLKKQTEQLQREEERRIAEHDFRMRSLEIERKLMFNRERRERYLHKKKIELLDLEISLKRKKLNLDLEEP